MTDHLASQFIGWNKNRIGLENAVGMDDVIVRKYKFKKIRETVFDSCRNRYAYRDCRFEVVGILSLFRNPRVAPAVIEKFDHFVVGKIAYKYH